MKSIGYVVHLKTPGKTGGETRSYQLANALAARGIDVHVYGQVGPSPLWAENVFPRHLKKPSPMALAQLRREFQQRAIDVCIERYHFPIFNVGYQVQRLKGKPIVFEVHGFPIEEYRILAQTPSSDVDPLTRVLARVPATAWQAIQRYMWNRVDHFIVTSQGTKQILQAEGLSPDKITVIYNRVDPRLFDPRQHDRRACRRQLNVAGDDCLLLYAGSMYHAELLAAIDAVQELTQTLPGLKLRFFGVDSSQQVTTHVRARRLSVEVFSLHPPLPHAEMPSLLAAADVVLAPYTLRSPRFRKGFHYSPLKILEALAMEKPVVTVDALELRSTFGRLPGVFFAQSGDVSSWVACIESARRLAGSPVLREGRHFVLDGYRWEGAAKDYVQIIESVSRQS